MGISPHKKATNALKTCIGKDFTKAQRKLAKTLSFQLQYGAGATGMAKDNGIQKKIAENFIKIYYARYPGVKEWQDRNIRVVKRLRVPTRRLKFPRESCKKKYLPIGGS